MKSRRIVATCVIAIGLAAQAQAASLEIKILGLDLAYDGSSIHDAMSVAGGLGDPALADPLTSMDFLVDGVSVGTLTTDIWADIRLAIEEIPVGGGVVSNSIGGDFGFDLLTSPTASLSGIGLALDLDEFTVVYTTAGMLSISGGGIARGILVQNLPFGLELSTFDDVSFAFSSDSMSSVTDDGTFLTGFDASGSGNVKGVLVPEPASATMLLMAGLGLVGLGRRRR